MASSTKPGRCINVSRKKDDGTLCQNATKKTVLNAPDRDFTCPECGSRLVPHTSGAKINPLLIGGGIAAAAVLAGVGYLGFSLLTGSGNSAPNYCKMASEERRMQMDAALKNPQITVQELRDAATAMNGCDAIPESLVFYRAAADKGDGSSALAMAKIYDPNQASPSPIRQNVISADAAYAWYRKAEKDPALATEATAALAALKAWAEKASAAGDATAGMLLQNWPE